MELLILASVLLLPTVAILSAYWFLSSSKHKSQTEEQVPPGKMGWPIIGENLAFYLMGRRGTPEKFIHDRMNNYSSQVFKTCLMGESVAVFCGSKGNKFIFSNEFTLVQSWWPHAIDRIFSDNLGRSYMRERNTKMKLFMPKFFTPLSLEKYIGTMDLIAKQHLDMEWNHKENVTVMPLIKQYTLSLVCRLFLGLENADSITRLYEHYESIFTGIISLPIDLPGTAFNRAIKASKSLRKELLEIIKQHRQDHQRISASSTGDLLTEMLNTPEEKGVFASDVDMASMISAIILASYDAPGTALTFVMKYLAELPDVYDQVLREQTEVAKFKGPGELLNWEDIHQMRYSWNVVNEVLRLVPPLQGTFREAITDFTFAGYSIPKGWKIHWNTYSTHKNPNYFQEPERFDPSRFEGNGPAPYTFVPFGGGPRMCPGRHGARLMLLVFLHNLVARFRWEKLVPGEKMIADPHPRPENGLPVRLFPHKP